MVGKFWRKSVNHYRLKIPLEPVWQTKRVCSRKKYSAAVTFFKAFYEFYT